MGKFDDLVVQLKSILVFRGLNWNLHDFAYFKVEDLFGGNEEST